MIELAIIGYLVDKTYKDFSDDKEAAEYANTLANYLYHKAQKEYDNNVAFRGLIGNGRDVEQGIGKSRFVEKLNEWAMAWMEQHKLVEGVPVYEDGGRIQPSAEFKFTDPKQNYPHVIKVESVEGDTVHFTYDGIKRTKTKPDFETYLKKIGIAVALFH